MKAMVIDMAWDFILLVPMRQVGPSKWAEAIKEIMIRARR